VENRERLMFLGLFLLSISMSLFSCIRCGSVSKSIITVDEKTGKSFKYQTDHINTVIGQVGEILANHKKQIDKLSGINSKQGGY
jgi:hypothetical protein